MRKTISLAILLMSLVGCGGGNSKAPAQSCTDTKPRQPPVAQESQSGTLTDGMFRTDYAQQPTVHRCQ